MIDGPVHVALLVLAVLFAAAGCRLVVAAETRPAGGLLILAGVLATSSVLADLAGRSTDVADRLLVAGAIVAAPLAACVYPRFDWRDPVDFAMSATVLAGGGVVLLTPDDATATTIVTISLTAVSVRLWSRLERGPREERIPLLWLTWAFGGSALAAGIVAFAGDGETGPAVLVVAVFAVVPVAMVVGVARPEAVDVRGLIVHTVVIAVTMLLYLSVFVGVASAFGEPSTYNIGALGVLGAVCALGFHPTTVILRGVIDRLLFGDRPDPLRAATQVVDRIGEDPVLALQVIREALVLPYASLRADGVELTSSGAEVTHTRTIALDLGGNSVGEMVVGLRPGDLRLSAADENVLRIVAPLLAQTIRARALAADLQASRGQAIAAIEEERRRLRRDLHDGLGPTLTGVAFATDAARNKLRNDPSGADELLARLRSDTADAISEIRRLVEGLRPPALDELGLVTAVRQQARGMHTAGGAPLAVTIDAPEPMPELPAAAEVAAFRIVVEALTNVARHSASDSAHVTLSVGPAGLGIVVVDAGNGGAPWRPGVGMSSMRERVEQVGGSLSAGAGPAGGRVEATIPLS
ncbi:MAG TPA: histidine kinase [Sporichthya sp.]|nr:histidine kinase [Sporichthya sp.]